MTTFENEHVEQSGNEQKDYANSQKVDSVSFIAKIFLLDYLTVVLVAQYSSETSSKIKGNTIVRNQISTFYNIIHAYF